MRGVLAAAALLASSVPANAQQVPAAYKSLYRFSGHPSDGAAPLTGLVGAGGVLYGMTSAGGRYGGGTVFTITTAGQEAVLHDFGASPSDGTSPLGSLLDVGDTLYGTTFSGGSHGRGTVFKITTAGQESVLYNFGASPNDGTGPAAGLIDVRGTLYGTTAYGGSHGGGTVFTIAPSGQQSILYNFGSSAVDGATPEASLLDIDGTLYGTTYLGGTSGNGTVFSLTTTGWESVLHRFAGAPDGAGPVGALVAVNGTLYSTTLLGGGKRCNCGTVFSVTISGRENVVYRFGSRPQDGQDPAAGLVSIGETLYGTTSAGGAPHGSVSGTVFKVTTLGRESVLYRFGARPGDGSAPRAPLVDLAGTLYGTASSGGEGMNRCRSFPQGCGTVFSIEP